MARLEIEHILGPQHLSALGSTTVISGEKKVFLDTLALFGLAGLRVEQTDNAIRVANG